MKRKLKYAIIWLFVLILPFSPGCKSDIKNTSSVSEICGYGYANFEGYINGFKGYFVSATYRGSEKIKDNKEDVLLQFSIDEEYFMQGDLEQNIEVLFGIKVKTAPDTIQHNEIPYKEGEKYLVLIEESDGFLRTPYDYSIPYNDIYNGYIYGKNLRDWVSEMEITPDTTAEELASHIIPLKAEYMKNVISPAPTFRVNEKYMQRESEE